MKIICNKKEFSKLVMECKETREYSHCGVCPLQEYCDKEADCPIEPLCTIHEFWEDADVII